MADSKLFLKVLVDQFDEFDQKNYRMDYKFKDDDNWDSLVALSFIAAVDNEFSIKISGDDLSICETFTDLYNLFSEKK
tara:strand:- start:16976 stop:17209 length:234 start_codon:yes stop_codon:yes gene_type:complete